MQNISLESATYLQNTGNISKEDEVPNFEVDSIELADPGLFSNEEKIDPLKQDIHLENNQELEMFENSDSKDKQFDDLTQTN